MQYIKVKNDGTIESLYDGDFPLDGFIPSERKVLQKYGIFYYEGDAEPAMPVIPEQDIPVVINSHTITYDDADALCQAMGAGEKTAIWLVAKLGL